MLTTLLSLLGGGLGGLLRFVPEIFKLFTEAKDRAHELEMTKLQLTIDKARADQAIDHVHAQSETQQAITEMQAYLAAMDGQGKMSGVPWVDALNQSVRPVVTYWWMSLLTINKFVLIVVACIELSASVTAAKTLAGYGAALTVFSDRVWTPADAGILAMILGFWFVDRAIRKNTSK